MAECVYVPLEVIRRAVMIGSFSVCHIVVNPTFGTQPLDLQYRFGIFSPAHSSSVSAIGAPDRVSVQNVG